jgi:hypothetical protein
MRILLKVAGVLLFGLVAGAAVFWAFTKTDLYKKVRRDEVGVIQEAVPIVYVTDPDVGPMLLPHTKIHFKTPYFDNTVVTNADGFTGRDYPLRTSNYRIAILGDSAVEAYGVPDTSRFTHMTELMVYNKTQGRRKVEFMGFGVSGWGNVQHYGAIRKYVLKYKPDEIWVMFLPTNEPGDNTPLFNAPPNGPTFVYKSHDSDEIVDIRFGYPDIPEALEAERKRRYGNYLAQTAPRWAYGLLPYFWSSESSPHWDLIMSHTYQALGLIKKLCDENHVRMVLVYRASAYDKTDADFDKFRKEAASFLKRDLPMERGLGARRFRKRMEDMGIGFIDMHEAATSGINTRADEREAAKHAEWASFFSDVIIKRLDERDAGAVRK